MAQVNPDIAQIQDLDSLSVREQEPNTRNKQKTLKYPKSKSQISAQIQKTGQISFFKIIGFQPFFLFFN